MGSNSKNIFASKEYHLLYWLSNHQLQTVSGMIVKFSQAELAEEYGCSLATVNKLITDLRKANCIVSKKRGCYKITNIGCTVIDKMNEIEKAIGGQYNGKN